MCAGPTVQSRKETKNWLQGLFKDRSEPLYRQFNPKSRGPLTFPRCRPRASLALQDQHRGLGFEV